MLTLLKHVLMDFGHQDNFGLCLNTPMVVYMYVPMHQLNVVMSYLGSIKINEVKMPNRGHLQTIISIITSIVMKLSLDPPPLPYNVLANKSYQILPKILHKTLSGFIFLNH